MSNENANVAIVQDLYQAFGRGDMAGVLARMREDAEWVNPYGRGRFPGQWGRPCKGREQIVEFFKAISAAVDVRSFDVLDTIAQRDKVVALIRWTGLVCTSGTSFDVTLVHVWTLRDGKVSDYKGFDDPSAYGF
jgi:ketosteroid isomerase-like protein